MGWVPLPVAESLPLITPLPLPCTREPPSQNHHQPLDPNLDKKNETRKKWEKEKRIPEMTAQRVYLDCSWEKTLQNSPMLHGCLLLPPSAAGNRPLKVDLRTLLRLHKKKEKDGQTERNIKDCPNSLFPTPNPSAVLPKAGLPALGSFLKEGSVGARKGIKTPA